MLRLILSGHLIIFPLSLLSSSFQLLPFPFLDLSLLSFSPPPPHTHTHTLFFSSQAFQKQHKTGDDCVKKKLQDLERQWEEICQMSVERQDRLEEAYKLIRQFQSHLTPLWSWMTEVLPMLDDSEPVHGDVDTTDAFMTAHSVSMSAHPAPNDPFSHWPLSISPPSFFPYPISPFFLSPFFLLFSLSPQPPPPPLVLLSLPIPSPSFLLPFLFPSPLPLSPSSPTGFPEGTRLIPEEHRCSQCQWRSSGKRDTG